MPSWRIKIWLACPGRAGELQNCQRISCEELLKYTLKFSRLSCFRYPSVHMATGCFPGSARRQINAGIPSSAALSANAVETPSRRCADVPVLLVVSTFPNKNDSYYI
jgi:hypothetical protein